MSKASNRGGKRAGSGREPGPLSTTTTQAVLAPPLTIPRHNLPLIEAKAHEAGALLLRGFSITETAAELGVERHTIAAWTRRYPEILVDERREKRDPASELAYLVPTATRAYGDLLQPEIRADVRQRTADSVYDRVFGKPLVRTESHERRDIRVVFIDATDTVT